MRERAESARKCDLTEVATIIQYVTQLAGAAFEAPTQNITLDGLRLSGKETV
jgi:hypothetical protein